MVFNEISIFDDVHQTVVNSGIETTYRSGALEFTSLFSLTLVRTISTTFMHDKGKKRSNEKSDECS
jgi:hypothetical protein